MRRNKYSLQTVIFKFFLQYEMRVYEIEKNGKSFFTWRQVRGKINQCVQHGACQRWMRYENLPYMKEAPPTKNFSQEIRHGVIMTRVGVEAPYISTDALEKADMILFSLYPNAEISAFALLRFYDTDMEISVICSREGVSAKPLVLRALEIAREKKKKYAKLHALRHVLDYYTKFGFHRQGMWPTGNNIDGWLMVKDLLSSTSNYVSEPSSKIKKTMPPTPEPERMASPQKSQKRKRVTHTHTPSMHFPVNTLVWAKLPSYPSWPARVIEPLKSHLAKRKQSHHVPVAFFGDTAFAWVPPSQLTPYALNDQHPSRHSREKRLRHAISLADKA